MRSSMAGPIAHRFPFASSRTACGSSSSTTASPMIQPSPPRGGSKAPPRILGSAATARACLKKFSRRMTYRRDDGHNRLVLEFDANAGPLRPLKRKMNATPAVRAAIRALSAFRDLSEANVAFLIEASEIRTFEPEATLMVQGEPSDCAMLLLEGEVIVTSDSPAGAIPISTMKAPRSSAKWARSRDCRAGLPRAPARPSPLCASGAPRCSKRRSRRRRS